MNKLHRIHAHPQASRLEFPSPLDLTWRADGRRTSLETKAAIAHRLAVCWNVLEGMPTDLLERGLLLELCQAVDAGDMDRAKAALAKMDRGTDLTDGRPHDCASCIAQEQTEEAL